MLLSSPQPWWSPNAQRPHIVLPPFHTFHAPHCPSGFVQPLQLRRQSVTPFYLLALHFRCPFYCAKRYSKTWLFGLFSIVLFWDCLFLLFFSLVLWKSHPTFKNPFKCHLRHANFVRPAARCCKVYCPMLLSCCSIYFFRLLVTLIHVYVCLHHWLGTCEDGVWFLLLSPWWSVSVSHWTYIQVMATSWNLLN